MILIGDAGGSGTSWRIINKKGGIDQFHSPGLNLSGTSIKKYLNDHRDIFERYSGAEKVFFYSAGLREDEAQLLEVKKAFKERFREAEIDVASDLLGAARALCQEDEGWVGILGTGSNLAHYKDGIIINRIPALGYILGDEGSGVHLGRKLLVDFCRDQMPPEIRNAFEGQFDLDENQIIKNTYDGNGRSFLSSFSPFIQAHLDHPYTYQLAYDVMKEHLQVFLFHHIEDQLSLHYSGSIAFYFSKVLRNAATDMGINIGHIVESPIAGLTLYHQKHN